MKLRILFLFVACFLLSGILHAEDCQKAVELYNEGTLSKDFGEKEKLFKEAVPLCIDPDVLAKVYNNLADAYETKGMLSKALAYYKRAMETKKELVTSYVSVGDIFAVLGDYYSAYVMYGKALENKPDDEEILGNREKAKGEFTKKMVIYFDRNSARITDNYLSRLQAIGESGKNCRRIEVIGYTCDLGSNTYNKKLSLRRAAAVANYLKLHYPANGIGIAAKGKGKSQPLLPDSDEESRILNRRVEIRVVSAE